jgi:ABC-type multidrug transport system ATPase subunit
LHDISFEIKELEVIVIIGSNGAGKTTLINILADGMYQTSGEITKNIDGPVGYVLQENVLIDAMTVREHFKFFSEIRAVEESEIEKSVDHFCDQLQLTGVLDTRAADLSGGQKRKLSVALSMLGKPSFLLMDEPTVGVDVQARQLIWKMLAGVNATAIITTHALEEAETVSSRLFILSNGTIPHAGTSTELRHEFKCGYILRLDNGDRSKVLDLARRFIPESIESTERDDTILIPISSAVPKFLRALDANLERYGVTTYSFSIESLDNILLKISQSDEVMNH